MTQYFSFGSVFRSSVIMRDYPTKCRNPKLRAEIKKRRAVSYILL